MYVYFLVHVFSFFFFFAGHVSAAKRQKGSLRLTDFDILHRRCYFFSLFCTFIKVGPVRLSAHRRRFLSGNFKRETSPLSRFQIVLCFICTCWIQPVKKGNPLSDQCLEVIRGISGLSAWGGGVDVCLCAHVRRCKECVTSQLLTISLFPLCLCAAPSRVKSA